MFADPSNWRSGAGGAAYWTWVDPTTKNQFLMQSQWPTVVRLFQQKCKQMLPPAFLFTPDGKCTQGRSVTDFEAVYRTKVRKPSDVNELGIWDEPTADALGFLICSSGQTTAAVTLGREITSKGTLSPETTRQIVFFMTGVKSTDIGLPGTPRLSTEQRERGAGLKIPDGAILPNWQEVVPPEAAADIGWFRSTLWGSPQPLPPSKGGATRPWPVTGTPPPTGGKGIGKYIVWGLVAYVAATALSSGSSRSSNTSRPRAKRVETTTTVKKTTGARERRYGG